MPTPPLAFKTAAILSFDVKEARAELQDKTEAEIDQETAFKWASRALAAYELYDETNKISWLESATVYYHEAMEHAAGSADSGETLELIQETVTKARKK